MTKATAQGDEQMDKAFLISRITDYSGYDERTYPLGVAFTAEKAHDFIKATAKKRNDFLAPPTERKNPDYSIDEIIYGYAEDFMDIEDESEIGTTNVYKVEAIKVV